MTDPYFELRDLDGRNGFSITGSDGSLGHSVAGVGDVNDDGVDDFILSAPWWNGGVGRVFLVFGRRGGFPANLDVSGLGAQGVVFTGISREDYAGKKVSAGGDANGDGIADLLISAIGPDIRGNWAGQVYVIFGRRNWPTSIALGSLSGIGVTINAANADMNLGYAGLDGRGDFNGDGITDISIGGGDRGPGYAWVVLGQRTWPAVVDLQTFSGMHGVVIHGVASDDYCGYIAEFVGDVNQDGYTDLNVGALYADRNGLSYLGESYLLFGHENTSVMENLFLTTLNGTNGVLMRGVIPGGNLGHSGGGVGDVNHDGIPDFLVSAPNAAVDGQPLVGQSYLFFGHDGEWPQNLSLPIHNVSVGVTMNGIPDVRMAGELSYAGDLNADGRDDMVMGCGHGDPSGRPEAGQTFVVFGRDAWPDTFNFSNFTACDGRIINGVVAGQSTGKAVSDAGDVNGDGYPDLIIGINQASNIAFVVFGGPEHFIASNFSIAQNETKQLNGSHVAVDPVIDARVIYVEAVSHGAFVETHNHSALRFNFTQGEINAGNLSFLHDGSRHAPNVTLSAEGITRVFADVYPQSMQILFALAPTFAPTALPTALPTAAPTALPSAEPTGVPTADPTGLPTAAPSGTTTVMGLFSATTTLTSNLAGQQGRASSDGGDDLTWLYILLVVLAALGIGLVAYCCGYRRGKTSHVLGAAGDAKGNTTPMMMNPVYEGLSSVPQVINTDDQGLSVYGVFRSPEKSIGQDDPSIGLDAQRYIAVQGSTVYAVPMAGEGDDANWYQLFKAPSADTMSC